MNTGGPAFPVQSVYIEDQETNSRGMTLRDYFAAKAMQGLIASNDDGAGDRIDDVPRYAYLIADSMLKAREQ
jgi:hypothetical protein